MARSAISRGKKRSPLLGLRGNFHITPARPLHFSDEKMEYATLAFLHLLFEQRLVAVVRDLQVSTHHFLERQFDRGLVIESRVDLAGIRNLFQIRGTDKELQESGRSGQLTDDLSGVHLLFPASLRFPE